jgi:hypothetical protein
MTRPLALIEGDLTIPLPLPFDGLPPPFGARRRPMRAAVQQAVKSVTAPARASRFPPGVKHILFYKAPPQHVDNGRWDAALAEAKRYLEMNTTRPRSSRSDHLLAASIFAGCTIALTWLLVTCSMKEAEKAKAVLSAPTVAPATGPRIDSPMSAGQLVMTSTQTPSAGEKPSTQVVVAGFADASAKSVDTDASLAASVSHVVQTGPLLSVVPKRVAHAASGSLISQQIAQVVPLAAVVPKLTGKVTLASPAEPKQLTQAAPLSPVVPKQAVQLLPRQTVQVIARNDEAGTPPAKPAKRVKVARLSEAHVNERMALNRATHSATQPAMSRQLEWTASTSRSRNDVSTDDAAWLNWSTQQHRQSQPIRAATPLDNSWNDHMTQRRITDDPAAFHTDRGGK